MGAARIRGGLNVWEIGKAHMRYYKSRTKGSGDKGCSVRDTMSVRLSQPANEPVRSAACEMVCDVVDGG